MSWSEKFQYICSFSSFRSDEFDWLKQREKEAADQCCCHGDVGRVEEEIVRHQVPLSSTNQYHFHNGYFYQQQLLTEVKGHSEEAEFISTTVEFLIEHTRVGQRDDIRTKAADFSSRYDDLVNSLQTYVGNLEVRELIKLRVKYFNSILTGRPRFLCGKISMLSVRSCRNG